MITRIPSEQLKVGMFIHHLECGWMDHPFLVNQFRVASQGEIDKIIQHGISHVSIDSARGLAVQSPAPEGAATAAEASSDAGGLDLDLDLPPPPASAEPAVQPSTLSEELVQAQAILLEASALMSDVMADARMGRMIELGRVEPVVEKMIQSVLRNPGALACLGRVRQKDHYTFEHSVNVSVLLVNFCHHMGLDRSTIRAAAIGGLLHDVGKVHTPDAILNKPGPLSDEEFAQIRSHVGHGVDIAGEIPGISDLSLTIVAQHHEHMDGGGYPIGLKGNQIAQLGQMAAIVDVYEALTSSRAYRPAMEPSQALQRIFGWSKQQFNNELVQRFIQCVGIYPVGTLVLLDSGMLAIVTEANPVNLLRPMVRVVLDSRRDLVVTPRDLNLAKPTVKERIVSSESAAKWKINMGLYL
jgi:putative nucleotidyltransferase with HDIG domain